MGVFLGLLLPTCSQTLCCATSTAACHFPSVQRRGELRGIRSEVNVSQENTMPNYAFCRRADRRDDLINNVKTFLICDNLKPPNKGSNRQIERETGGDEMIKVEMDLSRMFNICQQVTETFLQLSRSPDDAPDNLNAALAFCDVICNIPQK